MTKEEHIKIIAELKIAERVIMWQWMFIILAATTIIMIMILTA